MEHNGKAVLIRQDEDGDVREIYIFDTEEEAEEKMEKEFNATRDYFLRQGETLVKEEEGDGGHWYKNLVFNNVSFFWTIHESE